MQKPLRWSSTIARSGRFKDVQGVSDPEPRSDLQTSRNRYNVRFHNDPDRKRRSRRGAAQKAAASAPPQPPADQEASLETSLPDSEGILDSIIEQTTTFPSSSSREIPDSPSQHLVLDGEFPGEDFLFGRNSNRPLVSAGLDIDLFDPGGLTTRLARTPSPITFLPWPIPPNSGIPPLADFLLHTDEEAYYGILNNEQVGVFRQANSLLDPIAGPSDAGMTEPVPRLPASPSPFFTGRDVSSHDSARYMQFYIETVIARLTPWWETMDNPFMSFAVPASIESPILGHAICALAASQLALTGSSREKDGRAALHHKRRVVDLLRQELANDGTIHLTQLVSCIMMETIEVFSSGLITWRQWLHRAVMLVKHRDRIREDLQEGTPWLLFTETVIAMEIMTSVTANHAISISPQYWQILGYVKEGDAATSLTVANAKNFGTDSHFERLLGCPAVILLVLSEICQYMAKERNTNLENPRAFMKRVHRWEDLLVGWSPTTTEVRRVHLSEAFRHAALIHFSRRVRELPYSHAVVQRYVHITLEHLASLKNQVYYLIIAWPLMMAGLELDEEAHPQTAANLLNQLEAAKEREPGYTAINQLTNLLGMVWRLKRQSQTAEEKEAVDWVEFSAGQGWYWCFW